MEGLLLSLVSIYKKTWIPVWEIELREVIQHNIYCLFTDLKKSNRSFPLKIILLLGYISSPFSVLASVLVTRGALWLLDGWHHQGSRFLRGARNHNLLPTSSRSCRLPLLLLLVEGLPPTSSRYFYYLPPTQFSTFHSTSSSLNDLESLLSNSDSLLNILKEAAAVQLF